MAEDYEMPYEYEQEKKFDLTIPLLLLVLIGLVVAWKFGWLANIPGIGNLVGGQAYSILLVGNDVDIKTNLEAMATELNINYKVIEAAELKDIAAVDFLNQYNMIILTEKLYSDPSLLDGQFRILLSKYLDGGKKLMLYGVAGSRDPQEGISGWNANGMSKFIPVECKTFDKLCDYKDPKTRTQFLLASSKLKIHSAGYSHPITDGFGPTIPFASTSGELEVTLVNTVPGALRLIDITDEVSGGSYPAVVEMNSGVGGKTIYFAYPPANTPLVFKNAVKYILGA